MYVNTNQPYYSLAIPLYYTKEAFKRCSTLNETSLKGGRKDQKPNTASITQRPKTLRNLLASWPQAISKGPAGQVC